MHSLAKTAVLLFLSFSGTADAQGISRTSSPDTLRVPRELVLALLGGYARPNADAPRLVVGRLPEGFPAEVVPPGAVVLGGMAHQLDREGPGAHRGTAVIVLREDAMQAAASYEGHLRQAGWQRPPAMEDYGGFVPLPAPRQLFFCRDSTMLNGYVAARPEGGSHLRLDITSGMAFTPCDAARRSARPMRPAPLPTLLAPPTSTTTGQGSGSGRNYRETSTRLRTALGPVEIVAHYAAQLSQGGWTLGTRIGDQTIARQTATRMDSEGKPWFGVLTAVSIPGSDVRDVLFRLLSETDVLRPPPVP